MVFFDIRVAPACGRSGSKLKMTTIELTTSAFLLDYRYHSGFRLAKTIPLGSQVNLALLWNHP